MLSENIIFQIAITLLEGVGNVTARRLIAYCGGPEAVFNQRKAALLKIPGIGESVATKIVEQNVMSRAEAEIAFLIKNKISAVSFLDKDYPNRLKELDDSPTLIYCSGNLNLNAPHIISVVGTRKASDYGKAITEKIIEELAPYNPLILSGLAYGIDVAAHRAAVANNLQTIGVLAHGLDTLYPGSHRATADKMKLNGGLISGYPSQTKLDPSHFPERNKIVAAMTDAVLVVEASKTGGALITASLGNEYNRDVLAIPGRVGDIYSEGCNNLIKTSKALMVESATDICNLLGWELEASKSKKTVQKQLFVDFNPEEQRIASLLEAEGNLKIDLISVKLGMTLSQCSSNLFTMEMKGAVRVFPGTIYGLN